MNYLDYGVIALYSLALLGIGFFVKDSKTKTDFFQGGRSFGWLALLLSMMATQLSAVSFISAPAFVGFKAGGGLKWLTFEFAVPLAMIFVALVIVPPLYRSGVVSAYEFLEKRFGRSTRLLISGVFLLSRSASTGVTVYILAVMMEAMFQITFWQSIVLVCVITVLYSLKGGMRAVIISDAVQMVILVVSIFVCLGFGFYHIGGWSGFTAAVDPARMRIMDFSKLGFNKDEYGIPDAARTQPGGAAAAGGHCVRPAGAAADEHHRECDLRVEAGRRAACRPAARGPGTLAEGLGLVGRSERPIG